jgi:hypothetical protein
VREVLWFFDAKQIDPFHVDGRCLVRYTDGYVKQSVLPLTDPRLSYAMGAHGVKVRRPQLSVLLAARVVSCVDALQRAYLLVCALPVAPCLAGALTALCRWSALLCAAPLQATKLPSEPRHIPAYAAWDQGTPRTSRHAPFIERDELVRARVCSCCRAGGVCVYLRLGISGR